MLSARGYLLLITESEEEPGELTAEAVRLAPAARRRRTGPGARHPRPGAVGYRPLRGGAARSGSRGCARRAAPAHRPGLRPRAHPQPGPAHRPAGRAARGARRGGRPPPGASGAVSAELRGHFLLGRSFEDHGEWDQAEAPTGARSSGRVRPGCPTRRSPSSRAGSSCFQLFVTGQWDDALDAGRGGRVTRRPSRRRLLDGLPAPDRARPRRSTSATGCRALRRLLGGRGTDRHPLRAAGDDAWPAARGDPAAVLAPTTTRSAILSRLWHPWFTARIRLAAIALGALAELAPTLRPPTGARGCVARPRSSTPTATSCSSATRSPAESGGPRARRGASGSTPSCCGCAGSSGSRRPTDDLVEAWREAERLTETSATSTSSRGSGPCWPPCSAPPATPPAARETARARARGRRRPRCARRCSSSCAPCGAGRAAAAGRQHDAHAARAGDPGPGRGGPHQRRDRQAAVHLHQDRVGPRLQHPRQARCRPAGPRPPRSRAAAACSTERRPTVHPRVGAARAVRPR